MENKAKHIAILGAIIVYPDYCCDIHDLYRQYSIKEHYRYYVDAHRLTIL